MQTPFLSEIVIIFGLTIAVLFICQRLKIPTIVGFLLSGLMAGPHGFGLITLNEQVQVISDIGVVMLLFTIGIEFSLSDLVRIKKYVLLGGSLQVFITLLIVAACIHLAGLPWNTGIFMGFLISLSSTAIVLKVLQQRDEVDSPQGRASLAILIFQDIIVVPMMLFTPILAGQTADLGYSLVILLVKGAGIILLTLFSAQWIMPRMLYQVVRLRSQEIFLISIIVICFAVAWFTSSLGLSLSLGAFLAGLIISESEYSHQALSIVLPFRDVFTSFFFISIGMLLDVHFVFDHFFILLGITAAVLIIKTFLAGISTFLLGFPARIVILVAIALSQVGEFSFVLSKVGLDAHLLSPMLYQGFLAVSILTMAASPFLMPYSHRLSSRIAKASLPPLLSEGMVSKKDFPDEHVQRKEELNDHLIVIGLGISGQNLVKAAKAADIPYVIIEMNADTVRREAAKGEHIYYGDAIQESMLIHVQVKRARVMVIAITDPVASRGIVALARRLNPKLYIIVRTHYMREMKPLFKLGANDVIPEEFETSIEIFTIVMMKYLIPRQEIDRFIYSIRAGGYQMFRSPSTPSLSLLDIHRHLAKIDITTLTVNPKSTLCGRTLEQLSLKTEYRVSLLAIIRHDESIINPTGEEVIMPEDKLVLFAKPTELFLFSEVVLGKTSKARDLR
jgi:CPA2 family monovalent cation:H+ antiporter-2